MLGLCAALANVDAWATSTVPGALPTKPVVLSGATIHTISGATIPNGVIVLADGKISAVGRDVEIPDDGQTLDLTGKHIYPGLFQSYTDLGLVEIERVRASVDTMESGFVNPNVKSQVAVNPDSELIPVTRSNGVLLALTAPSGPLIEGTSAIMQLDGWTWESMTLQSPAAVHLRWPWLQTATHAADDPASAARAKNLDKQLLELYETFAEARVYAREVEKQDQGELLPLKLRWEALRPVLNREVPLIVRADETQQIQEAIAFAVRQNIRLVILGGYDAPQCAELLKQYKVPVIVTAVYRLPRRRDDPYDAPYTLPERLRVAGVQFCIAGGGRFAASNSRNLPYHAATAAAYGLPRDEAIRAITLYPAQILGVADRVGSLEPGKDATLIVTNGDPLEIPTQVSHAYIQGRPVDLNDRHKILWNKYQQKYRQLGGPGTSRTGDGSREPSER